jgi:hypothetical protein
MGKIYDIFIEFCLKWDHLLTLKGNNPYKKYNIRFKSEMCKWSIVNDMYWI